MKQIRITTKTGESVHVIAKGSVPQLVAGELTVALHDGTTLRLPIQDVNGYVVEDAKRPTKLDRLRAEFERIDEAGLAARQRVFDAARAGQTQEDEAFGLALADYYAALEDRAAALDAIRDQQRAEARAKAYAEKRKASGEAPKPKKPAVKKAAKK